MAAVAHPNGVGISARAGAIESLRLVRLWGQFRGEITMALKAPGILVFTLSIVLALAVLFSRFFGATIPYLTGDTTQFYAMWGAYLVLLLGCIMRGL
jgi:hypothetical protein